MIQNVRKWGNSLGIRLPKEITERFSLNSGSSLVLTVEKEKISMRPLRKKRGNLKELVARVTPKNKHTLIDFGGQQGKEVW